MKKYNLKDMVCLSKFSMDVYRNRMGEIVHYRDKANTIGLYRYGDLYVVAWHITSNSQDTFDNFQDAYEFYMQQIRDVFSIL